MTTPTLDASVDASTPAAALEVLVNRLTQELAEARRALAGVQQRLGTATRTLEGRTQELTEARTALSLLLATLDSTTEGVLAVGHFGRAMHYNTRFMEMWRIPADRLPQLNEAALLALQLTQVKDPAAYLRWMEGCKAAPDIVHFGTAPLVDGRVFECQVAPQQVRGKRIGTVTSFRDVTERERLGRLVSVLEAELPHEVAEAKATTW